MIETEDRHGFANEKNINFILEKAVKPVNCVSFTDFLSHAKFQTQIFWTKFTIEKISQLDPAHKQAIYDIAKNETNLATILCRENFRELEVLKFNGHLDTWKILLLLISQREQVASQLAKNWIESLPETQLSNFSLSKEEIILFLDLSLEIQSDIDSAYLLQLDLSDSAKNTVCHPFLYPDNLTYIDVFSNQLSSLADTLSRKSVHIGQLIDSGHLPEAYTKLQSYLSLLSKCYLSGETNTDVIEQIWTKVDLAYLDLTLSNCPIILTPWGFQDDSGHIGIELMVTINLMNKSQYAQSGNAYLQLVKDFMKPYASKFETIPFIHQYVFARNGINLPWSGTACAGERYIVFFDNENDNLSRHLYRSYYHKFIHGQTSEDRFTTIRGVSTVAHEAGHLGRMLDSELYEKMGTSVFINKIDEAKADTMANLLYLLTEDLSISPEEFLEQYLIDYVDELRASHYHEDEDTGVVWYSFSAKLALFHLFETDSICWEGEKIKITDGLRGVEVLAALGRQIFELYGDPNFREEELIAYINFYEQLFSQNDGLNRYLSMVYSSAN